MEYPVTFNGVVLSGSVMADVTVSCTNNVQRADILFYSPVGNIGSITLTPMQPQASEKEFYAGNQKLHINKITFSAAFELPKAKLSVRATLRIRTAMTPPSSTSNWHNGDKLVSF